VIDERLTVEIRGLEAFGRHGVFEEERRLGQRFVVDVALDLAHSTAAHSDDLADSVDYAALAAAIAEVVGGEPVALLERLAGLVADRCLQEPHAAGVTVTVRKPHVAVPYTLEATVVTLRRSRA
jgi:7,8-dihydroneopterin aldolase/epimerase/oxygenase